MLRRVASLFKEKAGVATSLLEATATIAVGATLAGAAITVVADKVQQARIASTAQAVQMIGDAINNFEKDNGFYPIFRTAGVLNALTAPEVTNRSNVHLLESEFGDEPELDANLNNVG